MQEAGKRFIGKLQDAFYGAAHERRASTAAPTSRTTATPSSSRTTRATSTWASCGTRSGSYGEDIVSLAAQDYFFDKSPLRRAFFENLTNLRAIDRKGGLRASERQAAEILAAGQDDAHLPRGDAQPRRRRSTTSSRILGHLALTYGVDILPVHIARHARGDAQGLAPPVEPRHRRAHRRCRSRSTELRRLTPGMTPADASREVARLARQAVRGPPRRGHARPGARSRARKAGAAKSIAPEEEGAPARHPLRRARDQVQARHGRAPDLLLLHARRRPARQVDGQGRPRRPARLRWASPRARPPTASSRRPPRSSRASSATRTRRARGVPLGRREVERRRAAPDVPARVRAGLTHGALSRHGGDRLSGRAPRGPPAR